MVNRTLARRYAIAILSLAADRGVVERVGTDLSAIAHAIGEAGPAHDFFVAPVVDRPDKERVLTQAFEPAVDEIALHALLLLVRKRREMLLSTIVAEYLALQRGTRGVESLTVTSARALGAEELGSLVAGLERVYRKKFEVTAVVDPALIGGVRILMGDRRIDASVAGRLDALSRDLFSTDQYATIAP